MGEREGPHPTTSSSSCASPSEASLGSLAYGPPCPCKGKEIMPVTMSRQGSASSPDLAASRSSPVWIEGKAGP
eukprot:3270793-Prorocentrum_lima.AAC.1